jgi:hypothetical protein
MTFSLDIETLLDFYETTYGKYWFIQWNISNSNVSTWYGVTVRSDNNRVSKLVLPSNNLSGKVS